MSKRIGQIRFVVLLWVYGFIYYWEVRGLDDPSEKMTIVAVFWIFTLFAALEFFFVMRRLADDLRSGSRMAPASMRRWLDDSRLRLMTAIIIYLVVIPWLGFYTASALAFIAFSLILGTRSLWRIMLTGGCVLIFVYVTFSYSLRLSLPQGLFM